MKASLSSTIVSFAATTSLVPPSQRPSLFRSQTFPATLHDHHTSLLERFQLQQDENTDVPSREDVPNVDIPTPTPVASTKSKLVKPKFSRSKSTNRIMASDLIDSPIIASPSTAVFSSNKDNTTSNTTMAFLTTVDNNNDDNDDDVPITVKSPVRKKPIPVQMTPQQSRKQVLRKCRKQIQVIRELQDEVKRLKRKSRRDLGRFKQTIAEWTAIIQQRRNERRTR